MKSEMQKGFEAQRAAGINVDWFTWQIAWTDARSAAGASEGQAETVGEFVGYQKIGFQQVPIIAWNRHVPMGTNLYAAPLPDARDAEIAALRERIAGMEKDARDIEQQTLERAYAAAYKADTMACNAIRALIDELDASSVASKEEQK